MTTARTGRRPAPKIKDRVARSILGPSTAILILGRRRQGKTLLATYLAYQAHRAGVRVLHNGPLAFGEKVSLEQMLRLTEDLNDALIFLDELHVLFDSGASASLVSRLISHSVVQMGHRHIWLLGTTQDDGMLGRRLIKQVDVAVFVASPNEGRTVRFKCVHQGTYLPPGTAVTGTLHRAQRYWGLYDTSHIVDSYEVLGMDADRIRQGERFKQLETVSQVILDQVNGGANEVTPGVLSLRVAAATGLQIPPERMGAMLGQLGVPMRRRGNARLYFMAEWPELEAADDA